MSAKPVIAVAFYSTWGHTAALAEEVIKGAESTGAIVKPYVIQETLPEEVLTKMHAGSSLKPKYPILTPNDLTEVDGFAIGAPTRYGRVPAQVSAFFDQCGQLWATGALVGKFVTQFTSVAGQHSGHESTAITTFPFYVHHGLNYVPIGYATQAVGALEEVQGGSPYGASTVAASDGSWQPKANDLEIARFQGKYFADFVGTFVRGKHAVTAESAPTASAIAASEVPVTQSTHTSGALDGYNLGPVIGSESTDKSVTDATATPTGQSNGVTATATPIGESNGTTAAATPTPASAGTPASAPETTKEATAETATPTTKTATTAAPAAPAPATATATATEKTKPAEKKKSGGFFSCCGSRGIDE